MQLACKTPGSARQFTFRIVQLMRQSHYQCLGAPFLYEVAYAVPVRLVLDPAQSGYGCCCAGYVIPYCYSDFAAAKIEPQ